MQSILLVDDDSQVLEALRRLMQNDGLRIRCARNADEALRILREDEIDLVITDHMMPGVLGIEFLKQVKQLHPGVARILLTGHATVEMLIEAINEGGIERIFIKPTPAKQIIQGVRQVLIRRQIIEHAMQVLDEHEQELASSGAPPDSFLSNLVLDQNGAVVLQEVPYGYRTLVRRLQLEHSLNKEGTPGDRA